MDHGTRAAFGLTATLATVVLGAAAADPPRLSPARPSTLANCAALSRAAFPQTTIVAASLVTAGTLTNGGQPVGEHCLVTGSTNRRTSPVDGQNYAIGFEMRLPVEWNGRLLYQGNGGTDGVVVPAVGGFVGGGPRRNALQMGFAVISSDAGHTAAQNPLFGLDPQARLDYGYQAVGTLTPLAKGVIRAAYGRPPDRSYIGGSSNGGRHAMVAAVRYAAEYDGVLAISPGFNLPKAALAQLFGAQQWARVATSTSDLETALPQLERRLIATAILAKCDALDGLADGLVQDVEACRTAFVISRDVPTCRAARDGTCLTDDQKRAVANVFAGARNSAGDALYRSWPYDAGVWQAGWADWKFRSAVGAARDPVAIGFIFSSPPDPPSIMSDTLGYALKFNFDTSAPRIFATSGPYTESAMSFMTPPDPTALQPLRERGGKMVVIHGTSDAAFSSDDTTAWYRALDARFDGRASAFARFFLVPGMGHSRGGPATDQFDALTALVDWVEQGRAPEFLVAGARGAGNPGGVNPEVPDDWSPGRTRPLCPFPLVARYRSGDRESASSFACAP